MYPTMKRSLLSVFILFLALAAQAQQKIIYQHTQPESYLMKFVNGGSGSQGHLNNIITELTKGLNRRPGRTEFVVHYEQQVRLTRSGNQLQVEAELRKLRATGDVTYRGFDVGDVLLPAKLEYNIKLVRGQQVVRLYTFDELNLKEGRNELANFTLPDTTGSDQFQVRVEPKTLLYTQRSKARFLERTALINDYYNADVLLAGIFAEMQKIRPDDVENIMLHSQHLANIEGRIDQLLNRGFEQELQLQRYDPLQLSRKLNEADLQAQQRRAAINHAIATLDQIFYNRGLEALVNGNPRMATTYFQKSVQVNPAFAPSHYQLAKLDFVNGATREAAARTRDLLTRMHVDPNTQQLAHTLMNDIYLRYLADAENLTDRSRYTEALESFQAARELCGTVPGLSCNMRALADGMGRAKSGIYRNMLADARKALQLRDLNRAEQLVDEARRFQVANADAIPDAREANDVLADVKHQYYLRNIANGKKLLTERNYQAALEEFNAAFDLERTFALQPSSDLTELAKKAAKPVLLDKIAQGQERVKANRLDDARALASAVAGMQSQYGLNTDTDLSASYKLLRDKIFTQECVNTQAVYDRHYQNAQQLIREKKYITAEQAFEAAIQAVRALPDCGISTATAVDAKGEILPAATYQKALEQVEGLVRGYKYEEAVQKYLAAERYYNQFGISKFGLDFTPLFDYALQHPRQDFTAEAARYFTGQQQEEKAIVLLRQLLENRYAAGKMKGTLDKIGQQLAVQDVVSNPNGDPKKLAIGHTKGHKKLKRIEKAYKKQWKKLKK